MSFDLIVEPTVWPPDLRGAWEEAMARAGRPARMGLPADYDVERLAGFVPWVMENGAAAGFEVVPLPLGPSVRGPAAPGEARRVLISSSAGRSIEDLRFQWFGAATLALVTRGTVTDPQEGISYDAEAAFSRATAEHPPPMGPGMSP